MKVLFVFSIGHVDGGAVVVWLNLIDRLREKGVEPYVIMPQTKNETMKQALDERRVPYWVEFFTWWTTDKPGSLLRGIKRKGAARYNARADKKIAQIIREEGIEMLIIEDGTIEAGLEPAKAAGIPVIWHFHEVINGGPGCLSFIDSPERVGGQLAKADCIVAVSEAIQADLQQQFPQLGNVVALHNGISDERVVAHSILRSKERVQFTLAQRIDNNKGQLRAIEAFGRVAPDFPAMHLQLVGAGKDQDISQVEKAIEVSAARERIELCGFRADMDQVWAQADVALNCSYMEGCSISIAECLKSGCLLLASDCEGNKELVRDGRGLMYPVDDLQTLAEKMAWVMENRNEARKIARKSQRWACAEFDLDTFIERFWAIMQEASA